MKMVDAMRAHIKNTPSLLMQLVAASGESLGEPLTCATWGGGNNKSEVCQFTVYNKYGSHSACPDKPGESAYDDRRVFTLRLERDENRQPLEISVGLHLAEESSAGPAAEFAREFRTLTGDALAKPTGSATPLAGAARATAAPPSRAPPPALASAVTAARPEPSPPPPLRCKFDAREHVEMNTSLTDVFTFLQGCTHAELELAALAFGARLCESQPTSAELSRACWQLGDSIGAYEHKFAQEIDQLGDSIGAYGHKFVQEFFDDLSADMAPLDCAPPVADALAAVHFAVPPLAVDTSAGAPPGDMSCSGLKSHAFSDGGNLDALGRMPGMRDSDNDDDKMVGQWWDEV